MPNFLTKGRGGALIAPSRRGLKMRPQDAALRRDRLPIRVIRRYLYRMFLHEFFTSIASIAAQDPNRPALIEGARHYSYAELVSLTALIRLRLKAAGVVSGDRVGVHLTNSALAYAAIYACILCGATYVPVAVDDPAARLLPVLEEAQLKLLISVKADGARNFASENFSLLELEEAELLRESGTVPARLELTELNPATPLYILFTSGSTGRPKGVPIDAHNVGEFSTWAKNYFSITSQDVFLGITRLTFDLSVFNLFLPLWCGASVQIARQVIDQMNPTRLLAAGVTVLLTVPRVTDLVFDDMPSARSREFPKLRHLLFCGEQLFATHIQKWRASNPGVHIHNCYGPTEATVACTCYSFTPGDAAVDPLPIGMALPGQRMDLESESGALVSGPGQGELLISGSQVSRFGYWRMASNRFFDDAERGRSFRSGDIVRRDQNGLLYWLMRVDDQVKIKGHRVDLGEIEYSLCSVNGVRELICLFDSSKQELIAIYSVSKGSEAAAVEAELKRQAELQFPVYMRPRRTFVVESIPRSKNGKVDRRAARALVVG